MPDGIAVEGITQLMAGLSAFAPEVAAGLRVELKNAGDKVRAEAQERFNIYDPKSAAGYRVYLRAGGARVDVEQSIGRTTGAHPEWGSLQMRQALIPSLSDKQEELFAAADRMIEKLGERL